MYSQQRGEIGFTLLELLIVIAILAILGAIVIFVLNPAETLRETRDSQRISDLATFKTAIALYITKTASPRLDNTAGNTTCENGSAVDQVYYSFPSDAPGAAITDGLVDGTASPTQVTNASVAKVDGTGWIKVNLAGLVGGSPISNMPTDPTNTITDVSNVRNGDLVYRYFCDANDVTFEINARLEASTSTGAIGEKMLRDGGDNDNIYEVGTKLTILGTGTF